jgi:AraC-like DNA-binding protein
MIWLFSISLFDDSFRLRNWQMAVVASTVLLPSIGLAIGVSASFFFFDLPQIMEFILLSLTLWVVASNWRIDLIARRRRLRLWFVATIGAYALALIFLRELFLPPGHWLLSWQYLPLALLLLGLNATFMQYREGALFSIISDGAEENDKAAQKSKPDIDPALQSALVALMQQERVYNEMGLTIGRLAQRLDVPEYRLREMINAGLGFRNFNEFLNSYRIADTCGRLADPSQEQVPVLTIAMDAGFRSLSSFNKAFKDAKGLTPTQFRKQALATSDT